MAISMSVTVTMVVSMPMPMSFTVAVLERDRLCKLLISKITKPSPFKHLLDLLSSEAMVRDAPSGRKLGVHLVGNKVNDKEHSTSLEPLSQPLSCQIWLVNVVKAKPHAGYVKVEELGVREARSRWVGGISQIALIGLPR